MKTPLQGKQAWGSPILSLVIFSTTILEPVLFELGYFCWRFAILRKIIQQIHDLLHVKEKLSFIHVHITGFHLHITCVIIKWYRDWHASALITPQHGYSLEQGYKYDVIFSNNH